MAKENKKAALSMEERLDTAMVPDREQPYKVPANWCWTSIGAINKFSGSSVDPLDKPETIFELYSVPSSAEDYPEIIKGKEIGSTKQSVKKGDVLLCKINPRINRVWYVAQHTENPLIASSEWIVVRNEQIDSKYLMWCMRSEYFRDYMLSNVSGVGGSLMRAQPKYVQSYPIPIPPLTEQQRIVDRIESLFAKLDEAKEKAQEVVDGYDARRAAILHKAFTGELTRNGAEQQESAIGHWETKRFYEVAEIKSNLVEPKDYPNYPHIAPDNIEKKTGRLLDYHTVEEDGVISGKHRFYQGQILYSKIRPNLSKVVLVDFDGLCSADMYPIEAKPGVCTRYLWYYMLSEEFLLQATTAGSRSVLPKINQKELSQLFVRVAPEHEQRQIVEVLDSILTYEQQAKESAERVVEQTENMKKSILARAFRGELGTNDPNDECAKELLKRALQETIIEQPNPTERKKRRKGEYVQMAKTIMEVLSEQKQVSPEKLKTATSLDIDSFYAELKALIESGDVVEKREDLEVFLEARHEDRQAVD